MSPIESLPRRELRGGRMCGVYFVQSGEFIKIGVASNVTRRVLGAAWAWNPHEVKPLGWIWIADEDAAYTLERKLHVRFASCRHRFEWFHATPELQAFIQKHAKPFTKPFALHTLPEYWHASTRARTAAQQS